jgi:hypothetical protein
MFAGPLVIHAGLRPPAEAGPPPRDRFEASLDQAVRQLAAYDLDGNQAGLDAIADLAAATHGKPAERGQLVTALADVLRSGAPRGAKNIACRHLATIGTAEAVPPLAGLLADENLSHMARYALERIPGPAADEHLRKALGWAHGKWTPAARSRSSRPTGKSTSS